MRIFPQCRRTNSQGPAGRHVYSNRIKNIISLSPEAERDGARGRGGNNPTDLPDAARNIELLDLSFVDEENQLFFYVTKENLW
jgi:hypothetical protein